MSCSEFQRRICLLLPVNGVWVCVLVLDFIFFFVEEGCVVLSVLRIFGNHMLILGISVFRVNWSQSVLIFPISFPC